MSGGDAVGTDLSGERAKESVPSFAPGGFLGDSLRIHYGGHAGALRTERQVKRLGQILHEFQVLIGVAAAQAVVEVADVDAYAQNVFQFGENQ
jgi:hypothetical protein